MDIRQGYSYHIKDSFFEMIQDKHMMSNKENGSYRPHYYAIQDKTNSQIYWMIPISSQVEKYKNLNKNLIDNLKTILSMYDCGVNLFFTDIQYILSIL